MILVGQMMKETRGRANPETVADILRNRLKMKYEDIGNFLKKKDHTTIMHGVEKITKLVVDDQKLRENIAEIKSTNCLLLELKRIPLLFI